MSLVPRDDWRPEGVEDLELNAWAALRETGSVCVTAGAGAGKTEFLAQKATYLLQTGCCPAPKRILAISFKRDAARNLAERVARRCPSEQARRFDSLTFDAFTKGILDRFRATIPEPYTPPADYQVSFVSQPELRAFLTTEGFHDVDAQKFERAIARRTLRLPENAHAALHSFWKQQYDRHSTANLTFAMINRLVDYLLRVNPLIRRALHATYPIVFLDEFQDTTHAQFELLRTAFDGSTAVFTAVGDDKQRIMGWAGAMDDAFAQFTSTYAAKRISLLSNWRSHGDLVRVQHVLAERISPGTEATFARANRDVDGDVAAIWQYRTHADEVVGLARWIAGAVRDGIPPHEIAILVRSRADDAENAYADTMLEQGIRLRNVARSVGGVAIQDILCEELTSVLLPLLRLGSSQKDASAWTIAQSNGIFIEGIAQEDEQGQQRAIDNLESFVRSLRELMSKARPDDSKVVERVALKVRDHITIDAMRRVYPGYRRELDFDRAWQGFLALLVECGQHAASWTEALDRFGGLGQVTLMTVHKSKGLEFHTMIFCGLDNRTWWSLKPQSAEELNSFFVAFTRAKQRAFFTLAADRGKPIDWIENLLAPAGVTRVAGPA
ncbi:MAG: UvrD-helicase domain-containing protein [Pirellulales bacterium]